MTRQQQDDRGTAEKVLDVAERLVQVRGFNGFSYADAATELGITKAALHYHFAGKAELGEALITRYASRFAGALASIDDEVHEPAAKLAAYARLYMDVLRDERMCLCGMLAAEYQTLPESMRHAVVQFFADNESWLEAVLDDGRQKGQLQFAGSARDAARMIVSSLEGAMLVARVHGDPAQFEAAADRLLAGLAGEHGGEAAAKTSADARRAARRR
jgi:TetR/AcrR family transcriptional regulator, transcriptional repressor for nem operon